MSLHGNPLISEATLGLFSFVPVFEQVLNPCMQMGWGSVVGGNHTVLPLEQN